MATRPIVQASPAPLRTGEQGFDIRPIAPVLRAAGAGMFVWPSDDLAFLGEVLRNQHTPSDLVDRLIAAAATPEMLPPEDRLAQALAKYFRFAALDQVLRLKGVLVMGPPGSGKTALIAKLAARLEPRRALVVTTDAHNPGGLRQLEEYTDVLGLALVVAEDAAALKEIASGAGHRTMLIDTVAAAPGDDAAENNIRALKQAADADLMLAMPSDFDAAEAQHLGEWAGGMGARLMTATRLDLVRRVGAVLSAADAGGLAFAGAGLAPHFAYGLKALNAPLLARRILTGALDVDRWRLARR